MTGLELAYLLGWLITVFDLPVDNRSTVWCAAAAIGCVFWPVVLVGTAIHAAAEYAARNVK
jgi:uncharacterized membrane protein YhdT